MKNFLDRATDPYRSTSNNFKFYVSASQELQVLNRDTENCETFEKPKPKLVAGEIIIAEGNRVLYFPNVADRTKGLSGNLYITNFRFIFDAYEDDSNSNEDVNLHQMNLLIGDHGSCLTNIQNLYQVCGEKKKKLIQDSQLTEKVKGLQIVCKTMKVFTFHFDQSPITQGRNIAKTLLHHAFPGRHQLLFAYDYSGPFAGAESPGVVAYTRASDWENELIRTCPTTSSHWRTTTQNQKFQMSSTLPRWIVVPGCLLDCDLVTASQSFRCNRPPVWTWSSANGAALVRTADLLSTITDRTQENRMLENIRKCHPHLKGPCIKDLDRDLPSVTELSHCYSKLRELCIPGKGLEIDSIDGSVEENCSVFLGESRVKEYVKNSLLPSSAATTQISQRDNHRQFKLQDSHLYSALENTKWLQHVSTCLKVVVEAVGEIEMGTTVVLQESDGRDTSAIISSLIQLVLDPHTRTIPGFQSLIQKEWIALGHPFCKRLGLLRSNYSEQSPVFLLFLDCVWQLQNQFPSNFEFTETYLTTLWDSVFVSIFDTFLFDCERDRADALLNQNGKLDPISVWNWNIQFSSSDVGLFYNPLFAFGTLQETSLRGGDDCEQSFRRLGHALLPEHSLPYLGLWTQCYFRWLPLLSIRCGGSPQIDIVHRQLITDIQGLLEDIRMRTKKKSGNSLAGTNSSNRNFNNNSAVTNVLFASGNSNNNRNDNSSEVMGFKLGRQSDENDATSSGDRGDPVADRNQKKIDSTNKFFQQEFGGRLFTVCKDSAVLFRNRNLIDNFFPFTATRSTVSISGVLSNTSNLSEYDAPLVYSLTD